MSKTLQSIEDEIDLAKESRSELDVLNSESKLGIWATIRDVVASVIWVVYQFFETPVEIISRPNLNFFS